MRKHYLDSIIAESNHHITVNLIGAGGNGSHMLTNLAILSSALVRLGHQPLFVRTFDDDIVADHNVGRQAFSRSDIGRNKAEVLTSRCNRYFGTQWSAVPFRFGVEYPLYDLSANFTISCVDSVQSRTEIFHHLREITNNNAKNDIAYRRPVYWLDIGNSARYGQVILGTIVNAKQPAKSNGVSKLKHFFDEYRDVKDDPDEPSCSLAESLFRQDLFINKIMATYAADLLWNLLHNFVIYNRGIYVNLETLKTTPIPV